MLQIFRPSLNWLLILVPVCVYVEHTSPDSHTLIFALSCGAIVPLAGLLGKATEHVADRAGENIGGFLNATLGNAAELIIAVVALRQGLIDVVKASLTGSIIGNVLLVAGLAFVTGGIRYKSQKFNAAAAQSRVAALVLVSIALIVPGMFHYLSQGTLTATIHKLSVIISVVLLVTYLLSLLFSMHTHKELFSGDLQPSSRCGRTSGTTLAIRDVHNGIGNLDDPHCLDERNPSGLCVPGGTSPRYVERLYRNHCGGDGGECCGTQLRGDDGHEGPNGP